MVERIGIVGGGQLGRMLTEAAKPLGFEVTVLDPVDNCPAAQAGAEQIQGGLRDGDAVAELVGRSDVTTWEIEHIDAGTLAILQDQGHDIQPDPKTLEIIQDKYQQKRMLRDNHLPVAEFALVSVPSMDMVQQVVRNLGGTAVLKSRRGGFDGRGNLEFDNTIFGGMLFSEVEEKVGKYIYAEQKIEFERELAVIAARDKGGQIALYPPVETVHHDNICHIVRTPAEASERALQAAEEITYETVRLLGGAGVFAIELFDTGDEVLINEIAPRVHNSGHLTIEANATSQFEQHIRAVSGMPLGLMDPRAPAAAMINILGTRNEPLDRDGLERALSLPDTHLHFYGKDPRPARKVGHITVLGSTREAVAERAQIAREALAI